MTKINITIKNAFPAPRTVSVEASEEVANRLIGEFSLPYWSQRIAVQPYESPSDARAADDASIAELDRFLRTAKDAALLVSVRTESERKMALDRIQDLMEAKPGTPAGEELSRLVDWVLEYDALQERREEIEALKQEIADLRGSISSVLQIVNGVMDVVARRVLP